MAARAQASRRNLEPYVPRLSACWTGPAAQEIDGSLVSLDISGFTALSERLQTRGRAGAEELVALISTLFHGLIEISTRYGGDVLKFRGDALLIFYSGDGHYGRAYAAATEMQALIGGNGTTVSSVGPVALRMTTGIYTGPCQFFLLEANHSELVVTGPAATETIRLESEAAAGEILVSGLIPDIDAEPWLVPQAPDSHGLERFIPAPLRDQLLLAASEPEHRLVTAAFLKFSGVDDVLAGGGLDGLHEQLASLAALVDETCAELEVTWLDSDIDTNGGKFYLAGGAPATTGEDEERVLRVVRRVLDTYEGALSLRSGINRGNAFCGDVGPDERRTYTVMGDTVNLAARLTARAEPGGILVTGDVLDRARTRYGSTSESFRVKGKARPITGYHVGAAIGRREDEPAAGLPLVGRETELATLTRAADESRAGEQRLVELVGEPGIGKSRLVQAVREQVADFTHLEVGCDAYAKATPYFAARALLRPLAGIDPDLEETTAGEELVAWVSTVAPDLVPWVPLLAIPFGASVASTPETDQIEPRFRRERLLDVVEQLLTSVLVMPTLLTVEDTHWADDASFELLRHLVRQPARRPWLVCATRRPQGLALPHDIPGNTAIELQRLGDDAARELALAVAGELALSTEALAAVRERSGGNPLFVRELIGAARSAGSVDGLPETVETVITSRIDTLPPEDRLFLRNTAVLGAHFQLDVLGEVLAGEFDDVRDLARWERLGEFVTWEAAGELSFLHDLFRAVAYEGMSFRRRREMHARVGDALERREAEPALLSLHFYEAARYEKAWNYSKTAGDRAREQFANVVAAELYERALASAEELELPAEDVAAVCEAAGDVADMFMDFDRASAAFAKARALVGSRGPLMLKEGRISERRGNYAEALDWIERASAVVDDEHTKIELEIFKAGMLFRQGSYEESIDVGEHAVALAEAAGELASVAHACIVIDAAQAPLGRFDPSFNERALAIYEELDDPRGLGVVLNNLGIHAYYAGRWPEALDWYRRSHAEKERSGDAEGAAMALNNEAEILLLQGRLEPAETLLRDALRVARAAGHPLIEGFVNANFGRLAARAGRFSDAHELLDEARRELAAMGSDGMVLEADTRLAECLVLEGRGPEAAELAARALAHAEELGRVDTLGPTLERCLGYALCQSPEGGPGRPHLERSLELARKGHADYEVALTLQALAETDGKDSREARELFEQLGVVEPPHIPLP